MESQLIIIGNLGSLLMGITLGVFGAGGSILTVPILTFIFSYPPTQASHYSLLVVGLVSIAGAALQKSRGNLPLSAAMKFAVSSMTGMFFVKKLLLPSLPQTLIFGNLFSLSLDNLILITFAVVMMLAAGSMIFVKLNDQKTKAQNSSLQKFLLVGTGISVGGISGFVGSGGGFLIVPALIFLNGLTVREASRVSLFVIALNSIWGFVVGTKNWLSIPFTSLSIIIGFALIGMLIGVWIQDRLPTTRLKPIFGVFVLVMGIYILIRSIS